jgi:hypothetical protein
LSGDVRAGSLVTSGVEASSELTHKSDAHQKISERRVFWCVFTVFKVAFFYLLLPFQNILACLVLKNITFQAVSL